MCSHGNTASEDTMRTLEPQVATKIYDEMIAQAKVPVVLGERLDLNKGAIKDGPKIVRIVIESGGAFAGKVFVHATYEGDLMAKSCVSYHVGREANSLYGETIKGLQIAGAKSHQFVKDVDPYITPGDPPSGLVAGVTPMPEGRDGDGDKCIQAYNFRMCNTDDPSIMVPFAKPTNYDERLYELLLRNFEAGDLRLPWAPTPMPNRKTDTNNNFAFSTDLIGMNDDYPDADYATRARFWRAHEDYQKGLMWTLANHPRVPEEIVAKYRKWGLSKDELADNNYWLRQLCVREARRRISDYVMSVKNCRRKEVVEDSVGVGANNMDSHNTQRSVTKDGIARNEGDIQIGTRPYPISYCSIRPKAEQCKNLLEPVCIAASHIAYGSIRMVPRFMVLGQSAATAAVKAVEQQTTIQAIDYAMLKARMLKDTHVLDVDKPPENASLPKAGLKGIVVADTEAETIGFQTMGHKPSPSTCEGYAHEGNSTNGEQRVRLPPDLPTHGDF